MKLTSQSLTHNGPIPGRNALAVIDPKTHVSLSANMNPHLAWSGAPEATRSFAVVCVDESAPTSGEHVNKEGQVVPASLKRADFYHWGLCDLSASTHEILEGAQSEGVTARGKHGPETAAQRHGLNDYTGWFAGDAEMSGQYFGYDGPCPPWNDELIHRYRFTVYALSCDRAPVEGSFTCADLVAAIGPHVLASATIVGTYTLNPAVSG